MPARVICVANQKGGVGKTATTTNLGISLFQVGKRVLLVDMDPQGNLTLSLANEADLGRTVADALLDHREAPPIIGVFTEVTGKLDLIPTTLSLASAEAALMNKLGREFRLRDQLMKLSENYDFILIDTPPSLGLLTINALVASHMVIIPTEARFFSIQGLQMLQGSIDEILYINPHLKILGILLSKFDKRIGEERTVAKYLRDNWGTLVFETSVGTNAKILEAASTGIPLTRLAKGNPTARGAQRAVNSYLALAEEVLARA
jgi:chromosome partitioning protein